MKRYRYLVPVHSSWRPDRIHLDDIEVVAATAINAELKAFDHYEAEGYLDPHCGPARNIGPA